MALAFILKFLWNQQVIKLFSEYVIIDNPLIILSMWINTKIEKWPPKEIGQVQAFAFSKRKFNSTDYVFFSRSILNWTLGRGRSCYCQLIQVANFVQLVNYNFRKRDLYAKNKIISMRERSKYVHCKPPVNKKDIETTIKTKNNQINKTINTEINESHSQK